MSPYEQPSIVKFNPADRPVYSMSGIHLKQVDFDALFSQLTIRPEIANNYDTQTEEGKERLNKLLYTHYEGNHLSMVPRCNCGHLHTSAQEYQTCEICGHKCLATTEKPIESFLWIACPDRVDALIAPNFWHMLKEATIVKERGIKPFEPIKWLCDPGYQVPNPQNKVLERMVAVGLKKGRYNDFINNFDDYYDALLKAKVIGNRSIDKDELTRFILVNRDKLFPHYLPLPSALNFPTERTSNRTYGMLSMPEVIDAVQTISSINNAQTPMSPGKVFHRVVECVDKLAGFYVDWWETQLTPKRGIERKHVFGSRLHFTFRAVISSITTPHLNDELHIPWALAMEVFSVHLKNLLMRRYKLTADQCQELIIRSTYKPNKLLRQLIDEIIFTHPDAGWPCLFSRNPVLVRGSVARMRIAQVKENPYDYTISVPPETLKAWNADKQLNEVLRHYLIEYKSSH